MQTKVLILQGHPSKNSLCEHLGAEYSKVLKQNNIDYSFLVLRDLKFDPILHEGYKQIQELESDLIKAQTQILECTHLVVIFPLWWSSIPALLKGFIDRTFLPGFAFKYKKDSPLWDKLLKGRSAEIIYTTDAPSWWNYLVLRDPAINMMKKGVLEFSGFKVKKIHQLDNIKSRKPEQIQKLIEKVCIQANTIK